MFRYAIFILFLSLSQLSFSSSFKAIASGSGYDLWAVAKDGRVYYRSNKAWQEVKGQELNWISANAHGEVWAINGCHNIYKRVDGAWENVTGRLSRVHVGANGDVWGLNDTDEIFKLSNSGNNQWEKVDGTLHQISVGPNGEVWGVKATGEVLLRYPGDDYWTRIPGIFSQVQVADTGEVWAIDLAGAVYRYNNDTWDVYPIVAESIEPAAKNQLWILPRYSSSQLDFKDSGSRQSRRIATPID